MEYLLLSFLAGLLTVLAPCVFPLLPVIVGGSMARTGNKTRPLIILVSLAASITLFTLALRASTLLIMIDPRVWEIISGGIIFIFGVVTVFPDLWTNIELKLNLNSLSGKALDRAAVRNDWIGAVLIGAALGPVFTSCSPTYALIVAVILPQSFTTGFINLVAYVLGIMVVFGSLAVGGNKIVSRWKWAVNPKSAFRKLLGASFVVLGLMIITGLEKKLEAGLLDIGYGSGVIRIESSLKDLLVRQ